FQSLNLNTDIEIEKPPSRTVEIKPQQEEQIPILEEPTQVKEEQAFERNQFNQGNQNSQSNTTTDYYKQSPKINYQKEIKKIHKKNIRKQKRNKAHQIPLIGRFLMGLMDFIDIFRSFARGE
ncbi:hypothetical protein IJJ97_02825, partial [bacterium]|nr:hypothetical protein [bacterium]